MTKKKRVFSLLFISTEGGYKFVGDTFGYNDNTIYTPDEIAQMVHDTGAKEAVIITRSRLAFSASIDSKEGAEPWKIIEAKGELEKYRDTIFNETQAREFAKVKGYAGAIFFYNGRE